MRYNFHPFKRPAAENGRNTTVSLLAIPELSDGFDSSIEAPASGMIPVSQYTDPVPVGTYKVHIELEADADVSQLFLFTGRKQLRDILTLKKGDRHEYTFYQSVAEILPRYYKEVYPVQHLFITYCAEDRAPSVPIASAADSASPVRFVNCYAEPAPGIPVVYLCGDSTVTDQSSGIPYHPSACYASWGQALPAFLGDPVAVENQAHCGLTTESFREEGHMDIVKKFIHTGDFCLIQFGHNDQKLPHLLADREYPVNLKRYIEEVRSAGATPVLVTSPGRNIWKPDGAYHDLLEEHVAAVKRVATETSTDYIDLHDFAVKKIIADGMEASCRFFHPGDYTHSNEYGAFQSACYIADNLHALYPDIFTHLILHTEFTPPSALMENQSPTDIRVSANEEKEQFDTMEKSAQSLLEAIQSAKKQAARK